MVVLTGLPGAGKSTVGRALAERLGWQFYDLDEAIPDELREINRRGEFIPQERVDALIYGAVFRDVEALHRKGNLVMSAMLAREEYAVKLKEKFPETIFMYLTAPKDVLVKRVHSRADHFMQADVALRAYGSEFDIRPSENIIRSDRPLEEVVEDCLRLVREGASL